MLQSIPLWVTIFLVFAFISIFVLFLFLIKINKKLKGFMSGKDAKSLESVLEWLTKKNVDFEDTIKNHKIALENLDSRIKKSVRGYSLVRYNAYEDHGGNQSFACGILDENGDGFILSVISNRNHVGVYAKPIEKSISISNLTQEESLALEKAKKSINYE